MHRIKRHVSHAKQRKVFFHPHGMRPDSLNAGIIHLDENLQIIQANHAAATILKTGLKSFQGIGLKDLLPAEILDRISCVCLQAQRDHAMISLKTCGPGRQLIRYHGLSTGTGFVLILEDITGKIRERAAGMTTPPKEIFASIRAGAPLPKVTADTRAIFDAANDVIFIHDPATGRILDVNKKITDMYGYTPEEARRLTVEDLSSGIPPYTEEGAQELIRKTLVDGELMFEWQARDKEGRIFWEEVNLKKALIAGEIRIVAVVRDITERKQAQEKLRESQVFLSTLLNNLPGMAYRCKNDEHWTMEFVSKGCQELTGYRPEDLVENRVLPYASLIHPDDRAYVWEEIQKAHQNRCPFTITYRIKAADSRLKWVWEQGQGIFSSLGEVTAVEGFITDITEHKEIEERLRKSEQRLVMAQRSGRVGIFDWDILSDRHFWSDEMREIYHLPHDFDGTFESWKRLIHPDDLRAMFRKFEEAVSMHLREVESDYRVILQNGEVRWYTDRGVIHYDESGRPVRVIGATVDITERKKTQDALQDLKDKLDQKVKTRTKALNQVVEKLKEQKEILQTVIDHIPAMLIFTDHQGKVRLINREMERVSGWSLEEARNMDFITAAFPDERMRSVVLDAVRKGRSDWLELEAVTRSGETHPCLWTHVRLSDGSVIGIGIDISARRKMEQDLKRLAFAIEQAGEGIVLLNPDWVIEYVNPAFERISGYSRGELIGRRVDCVRENFLNAQSCEEFNRTLAQGRTWNSHQRRQNKSGTMVEVNLTVSPVHDEKGQTVNYVSVVRDVTREIAISQRMSQNQKLEAIGTLAGGIAHDLKNIFTPIVLNAEIALMDLEADHPAFPLIREIQEAAKMGSDLTRQIVAFSRRSLKEKTPLQITPLIEEALSFLRSALPTTIAIHPRLSAGNACVLADPTQIKQVMLNLGNNAGYAMRKHGGELVVELSRETLSAQQASGISPGLAPGPYVRITVRDTGEGMDEAIMQRIFDPFFTTKDKAEGTGMGLSVVHGIVRDHRGGITVQSEPGRGAAFTVYLPEVKGPAAGKNKPASCPAQ